MDCVGFCSNVWNTGNYKQETLDKETLARTFSIVWRRKNNLSLVSVHKGYDYMIVISGALFLGVMLVMALSGSVTIQGSGGLSMDTISACRQNIIHSEQMGYYSSPEQFRLAESYCYV